MNEQKKFSPNMDISSVCLQDIAPDEMIRVYPYLLPNTKKGDMFMSENSTTLAYYTQIGLNEEDLTKDENDDLYFEMLPSMTTLTTLDLGAGISEFHKELSEIYTFNGLANYYPKKLKKDLIINDGVNKYNLTPMIFSIGAPINPKMFSDGEMPIFISSRMIPARDSESDLALQHDIEGLYEITFVNITTLENQYLNSEIKFLNFDTQRINDIKISLPNNSLFGGISGKSIINNSETDISFDEPKGYPIWNAVPNNTQDRLEMFMKWADTKMVLPIHIIQRFSTQQPLSTLFKDDNGAWLKDGEDLFYLLKDMILYTKLYVDQWKDIQSADKLSDPANSNYGQVKINVTLGSSYNVPVTYQAGKRVINLIIGKSPAEVIETLYETYLNDNPSVDKGTLSIFKASVVALSRYIRSGNLALGGGLNDFNSIYLPWRLKTANKITVTRETIGSGDATTYNYEIKEDPGIVFDSHWFTLEGGFIHAKKIDNLYKTQLIQSERNITQPLIPSALRPMNITSNPGGVDIGSDIELSYNWWIPTSDRNILDTLMLKDLNVTITDDKDRILNDRTVRITDETVLKVIKEINALLAGDTLAATFATETSAIKQKLQDWYGQNFFVALLALAAIAVAQNNIIKATGFAPEELKTFGVTGVNWLENPTDHIETLWNFMKVINVGFDNTGFGTINHAAEAAQMNGEVFLAEYRDLIDYPVQNWLREIKGSWLNKYVENYIEVENYLRDKAVKILMQFRNTPDWDQHSYSVPQDEFIQIFPGLKNSMDFTNFTLTIQGALKYTVELGGQLTGRHAVFINGVWYNWGTANELRGGRALITMEIIEKIYYIFPNNIHYSLKDGTIQSFDFGDNRKLIFTKDEWHNLIRAIKSPSYLETIDLKPIKGDAIGRITELNVVAIWHDKIRLIINGVNVEIDAINAFDETISKQRIIFT